MDIRHAYEPMPVRRSSETEWSDVDLEPIKRDALDLSKSLNCHSMDAVLKGMRDMRGLAGFSGRELAAVLLIISELASGELSSDARHLFETHEMRPSDFQKIIQSLSTRFEME